MEIVRIVSQVVLCKSGDPIVSIISENSRGGVIVQRVGGLT